jgi:hypothetical protein
MLTRAAYLLLAVALFGAARALPSPSEDPRPGDNGLAKVVPSYAEIRAHLKPWHPFQKAWAEKASLVIKATYFRGKYPCVFFRNGSAAMPVRFSFEKVKVLKGDMACANVDVCIGDLDESRFPHDLASGRSYLVFLKPYPDSAALLKDPATEFTHDTQLSQDELVAIIDLSQNEAEAEAVKVPATRSGTYRGFTFTPEKWAALRAAKVSDLEAQKRFQAFIEGVVATPAASLADVRSYLGKPDRWYRNTDGLFYEYSMSRGAKAVKGLVVGSVALRFSEDLELARCSVRYYRCLEAGARGSTWRQLSADELKQLRPGNVDR